MAWFLRELASIDYVHLPELAPTKEMLSAYRRGEIDWPTYEASFLNLMRQRHIEDSLDPETLDQGCLLCSEDQPHHCHRRLVAEYLNGHWGGIKVQHLGAVREGAVA